jgi:hypothetical protein
MSKKTMLAILLVFAGLILVAGCTTSGCTTSHIVDQKVLHNQIVKNKISLPLSVGRDCVVVLSDYSQYRVWYPLDSEINEACFKIPTNENVTLVLTKYSDSEERYDVTDYSQECNCPQTTCCCERPVCNCGSC